MIVIFETSESDYFNLEGALKIKTKKKKKKKNSPNHLDKTCSTQEPFSFGSHECEAGAVKTKNN